MFALSKQLGVEEAIKIKMNFLDIHIWDHLYMVTDRLDLRYSRAYLWMKITPFIKWHY